MNSMDRSRVEGKESREAAVEILFLSCRIRLSLCCLKAKSDFVHLPAPMAAAGGQVLR